MKQEITEAAIKWFKSLIYRMQLFYTNQYFHVPKTGGTHEEIVSIWIQEVVMKWWNEWVSNPNNDREKWNNFLYHYRDGMDVMQSATNEEIALFYLQENKEVSKINSNPQLGNHNPLKKYIPQSDVSVSDLLKQREDIEDRIRAIDPMALVHYELEQLQGKSEEKLFNEAQVDKLTKDSKELIRELVEALEITNEHVGNTIYGTDVIEKANNYLKS
jgi:hypothetical protein